MLLEGINHLFAGQLLGQSRSSGRCTDLEVRLSLLLEPSHPSAEDQCGLTERLPLLHIPRDLTFTKLKALAEGVAIVRRELTGG
jgi:hypothetical protein